MNKWRSYISLVITACIISGIHAQQPFNVPDTAFSEWRKNNLQEKLFVHTDKDQYTPGEIAWFKIYYVDGSFHKPLHLSKVACVELVDASNKPVLQKRVSLKNADAGGSMVIPADLKTGYYKLRCYTQWMKNFDPGFFFEKQLAIINIEESARDSVAVVKYSYDLGLFPEGGTLVNGIESKVAFHITDQYGKGVDGKGVVLDGNDTLAGFQTNRIGMGHFILTPVSGHKYLAKAVLSNGEIVEKELPFSNYGIAMQVIAVENEKLSINLFAKESTRVYVFAHTRGSVRAAGFVSIVNGRGSLLIDRNRLGTGITHFTVFRDNLPVCERLYFVFPKQQFHISASADSAEYGTRKRIRVHIQAADNNGNAVKSKVSASVYRLDSLQDVDEMNIQDYLLLTSDLKGYIESPSWYFEGKEPAKEEAMDDLMLTQGWRRFKWSNVLQNQKQLWSFAPEYDGEIISARLTSRSTGLPLYSTPAFLSIPGTITRFWSSVSDANGIVTFELKNSFGSRQLVFESPDSNAAIQFISPFSTSYPDQGIAPFTAAKAHLALLNKRSIYVQVQNAYNEARLNNFVVNSNIVVPFYQKPDVTYTMNRYTRFTTLEEVMREYIREVNVSYNRGTFHWQVFNSNSGSLSHFQVDPLILLDGVAILNLNKFMNFDPLKLNSVNVVTKKYFLGNISYYGIVDFKTHKGDMNGYELDPNSIVVDFEGLQQQREFYSPRYEQGRPGRLPDFRTVLYWNPSLKVENTGNEDIEFYSSDIAGKYVMIIQGISDEGSPAVTTLYFNVNK